MKAYARLPKNLDLSSNEPSNKITIQNTEPNYSRNDKKMDLEWHTQSFGLNTTESLLTELQVMGRNPSNLRNLEKLTKEGWA